MTVSALRFETLDFRWLPFKHDDWEHEMDKKTRIKAFAAGILAATFLIAPPASAQQISPSEFVTTVNITVSPYAMLEFNDPNPLLYLEVPPPGSTIPSNGVGFTVIGNASATLSAEPDAFMQVPTAQYPFINFDPWLGRATHAGQHIGYNIELIFPVFPSSIRGLPLDQAGPAVSPLVNVAGSGGAVGGVLHLIANPNWTAGGGMALPGLYEGEIILTLTAS